MSFRKRNSLNTSHIKHDDAKENIITLTPKKDNKNETSNTLHIKLNLKLKLH